jgi:cell division protein FtsB
MCTMLSAKKNPVPLDAVRDYRKELNYLHQRRDAIDALIASLQEYDRYRCLPAKDQRRKTA